MYVQESPIYQIFKQEAVQLVLTPEQPIVQTAKELGVLESTLYSWVSSAKSANTVLETNKEVDVGKLHAELLKL